MQNNLFTDWRRFLRQTDIQASAQKIHHAFDCRCNYVIPINNFACSPKHSLIREFVMQTAHVGHGHGPSSWHKYFQIKEKIRLFLGQWKWTLCNKKCLKVCECRNSNQVTLNYKLMLVDHIAYYLVKQVKWSQVWPDICVFRYPHLFSPSIPLTKELVVPSGNVWVCIFPSVQEDVCFKYSNTLSSMTDINYFLINRKSFESENYKFRKVCNQL